MANQSSSWHLPHLPPLEADEFIFDGLETQFDPSYIASPTPNWLSPGEYNPLPACINPDYTAGAVFDFIDDSEVGFDDIPWNSATSGHQPLGSPLPPGLDNATAFLPFHPVSHGAPNSSPNLARLEFERKVLALLDPSLGTVQDGELKIECLDAQQEDTLNRISRERGLAIRFEPSPYPNRPRVAIIPRHASHAGPGPPVPSPEPYHPHMVSGSRFLANQFNSLETRTALSWPPPAELPLLSPNPLQDTRSSTNGVPSRWNNTTETSAVHLEVDVGGPSEMVISPQAATGVPARLASPLPPEDGPGPKLSHIRSFKKRILDHAKSPRQIKAKGACYPCRLMRKKCDSGEPCRRCVDSADGVSSVACRRGLVADLTKIPMLCFLPPEPQQPTSPASPQGHIFGNAAPDEKELEDAANVLEKARRVLDYTESRRHHDLRQIRASGKTEEVKKDRDLLVRVVTAKIKDLRGYVYNLGEGKCDYDFPYDDIIQKITWEVVDNPNAATIMGAEDVEDLVALLEAASRCEAKFREWGTKKRLVYQSLRCLRDCLEALRLYAADALTSSAHIHCKSPKCTSPGLAGLSERLPRYINCLTSALLQKKRDEVDDWLLVFYSLCIQSYVRRVLIRLEHGWQQQSKTGNTGSKPGCSDFLQTAVTLFCQVSAQKGGRLAAQIKDSPVQASAYVGVSSLGSLSTVPLAQPTGESPWAWDQWREEGVERHLKRIFDTQDNALVILHCPDDEAYDSDATITTTKAGAQRGARRNRESNGSLQQLNPSKRVQLTEESLSTRATTPSISSRHSMTSYADSDVASLAETWNSSTLSFSTYNTNLGE